MNDREKLISENLGLVHSCANRFKNRGVELTSTEILKVAHHGSKYSTSANFLEYLNVKTAIISSGKENAYGHPTKEVLDRLQEVNAEIYRTDKEGNI